MAWQIIGFKLPRKTTKFKHFLKKNKRKGSVSYFFRFQGIIYTFVLRFRILQKMSEIRVRFAPSPTGALHIGGVRTALYNYLFAKQMKGTMVLRIEDTDQKRYVEGAEKYILESLKWCGFEPDESPEKGGAYGPYRQSERKHIYKDYAQKLVDEGNAYYAFDTPEELDEMRERLKAARVASPQYNSITRMQMRNSLTLSEDEVKERISNGEAYVIRLKVPRKEEIRLNDAVRGWVMVHSAVVDDKILMKSDGMPTYHLANVVDDHLMKITHVIRGEEWLPSAPCHVLLYKYLGWEDEMPQFAHLPLILKPDGNGKIGKRDAVKGGFPIFPLNWTDPASGESVLGFKESGYLPETVINFLALLGWSPGNNDEHFTMDQLIEAFSLERIGKSGVKFDINKANWFNEHYLRSHTDAELALLLKEELKNNSIQHEDTHLERIASELKERITFPQDLFNNGAFFFVAPTEYDEKVVRKKWNDEVATVLQSFASSLDELASFTAEPIKEHFSACVDKSGMKFGAVMQPLRVSLTGLGSGSDLMNIMEILGKEEVKNRINSAIENIKTVSA